MKHHSEMHSDREPLFTFHFVSSFMSSIERRIKEGLAIERMDYDIVMNNKGEWGTNVIPRPTFEGNNVAINATQAGNTATSFGNTAVRKHNPQNAETQEGTFEGQFHQRKKKRRRETKAEASELATTSRSLATTLATDVGGNQPGNSRITKPPLATEQVQEERTVCANKQSFSRTMVPSKMVQQRIGFEKDGSQFSFKLEKDIRPQKK